MGSFEIRIHDAGNGQALFEALNTTGLASGTRILGTGYSPISDRPQAAWGPGGNFQEIFYWWEQKPQ